jgi:hypothetical protein
MSGTPPNAKQKVVHRIAIPTPGGKVYDRKGGLAEEVERIFNPAVCRLA